MSTIKWAGGVDVTSCRPTLSDDDVDPERGALSIVVTAWPKFAGADGMTLSTAVNALWSSTAAWGKGSPDDGWEELRGALIELAPPKRPGDAPDPTRLGWAFRRNKDRLIGGRKLTVSRGGRVARWVVR